MSPFQIRRLDDEVAYVTGASSGIGSACAMRLAALGAHLHLGARRADRLESLASQIKREYPTANVSVAALDVQNEESIREFIKIGQDRLGPCRTLVNNAGLARGADRIENADRQDWREMIDTNVSGLFHVTQEVLPSMHSLSHANIVMIASVAGVEPYAGGSVYCATKAAVQAFSQSLRAELLGTKIRVLTFDPGMVDTEFSNIRFRDSQKAADAYRGMTPLSANDIADCVGFAVSRPLHMSIDRMLILAQAQLGARQVARTED